MPSKTTPRDLIMRDNLIREHLPLVKKIADRLGYIVSASHGQFNEEDLVSYGTIGLIEAVDRYQLCKGDFTSYVKHRIKGAILDHVRKQDKLKRNSRQKVKQLSQVIRDLEQENGQLPSNEQIAAQMQITLAELYAIQRDTCMTVLSLDACLDNEEDGDLLSQLPDNNGCTPEQQCEKNLLIEALSQALTKLPEKEKLILGLYHFRRLNMKEISQLLNISESRVCQLHNRGIALLKSKLENW